MAVVVQKFGGTSVANAERIRNCAEIAVRAKRAGKQVVMVVSARGHKTDELIDLAGEVSDNPPAREMDMLLSTGEQESVALMAMAVQSLGEEAISMTGAQMGIRTDSAFTRARIKSISTERMRHALDAGKIVIAAGFQGVDDDFNITTLGRGGSDTTAVALAAVLQATVCEIYTDVDGIYTTDPRLVPDARRIPCISYDEMLELTSLGGGKMHSRSIEFAKKYRVPTLVRPSYKDDAGTLITTNAQHAQQAVVTAVALARNEARVSLVDIPDRPGVISAIFSQMADRKIALDMVVQNVSSGGFAEVAFTVPQDELAEALTAAHAAVKRLGAGNVQHGTHLAKVSIVGSGMQTHTGVAGQLFRELSRNGVNILMITTSDIKISVLVDRAQAELALKTVHAAFNLDKPQPNYPGVGEPLRTSPEAAPPDRAEYERAVVDRLAHMEDILVSEVQLDRSQGLVTLHNVPDEPGVAADVFSAVADAGIMVDVIVQNASQEGRTHISFTVPVADVAAAANAVKGPMSRFSGAEVNFEHDIALLSVLGVGLRTHTGVGERLFKAIAAANVNVRLISTSEIRVGVVVDQSAGDAALQALQAAFNTP